MIAAGIGVVVESVLGALVYPEPVVGARFLQRLFVGLDTRVDPFVERA